ncbi:hypothetical protein AB3R30_19675 [Leptolyngbyaceae cyanobacterium UHCC 1019]
MSDGLQCRSVVLRKAIAEPKTLIVGDIVPMWQVKQNVEPLNCHGRSRVHHDELMNHSG